MSLADEAARAGLHKVGARPPFWTYLREVWRRRQFIYHLARYRIEAENGQNRLGVAWIMLKPLIDAVVYGVVFGMILMRGNIPDHYILFLVVGVFFFDFFSSCFTAGAKSITRNANLVQSLSFPRMALPLALVTEKFLEFVPMLGIIFSAAMLTGLMPTLHWLLMIPIIVLFTIFNTGVAMLTARLTVHFRDLTNLLPFASRLLFYTSGIFYSMELRFGNNPVATHIIDPQPLHETLSLARSVFLNEPGFHSKPEYWLYMCLWATVSIIGGSLFFWAAEEEYGRVD